MLLASPESYQLEAELGVKKLLASIAGFNFFKGHTHCHNFGDMGLDGEKCWLDHDPSSAQTAKPGLCRLSLLGHLAANKILVLDDAIANTCL